MLEVRHTLPTLSTRTDSPARSDYIFLGMTCLYAVDVVVRVAGLGHSFLRVGWNLYDLFVVTGTLATTIPILVGNSGQVITQLQKLFLVAIVLKLAQRNDSLNQLFKTAAYVLFLLSLLSLLSTKLTRSPGSASLPAILNIFALWLVMYLVWSLLMIEAFGLTRWGSMANSNSNFYTFFNSMVLLALTSTGYISSFTQS